MRRWRLVWLTVSFLVLRSVLGAVRVGLKSDDKDVEIAVLRHQLVILERQVPRPRFNDSDRLLLSMLAALLPGDRWGVFLVTPATLWRWHRDLVRRHWTQPHRAQRPGLADEAVELVWRLARENPLGGMCASLGSAPWSGRVCRCPRCETFCAATVSDRLPDAADPPGSSSCAPRPRASWLVTSSVWKR